MAKYPSRQVPRETAERLLLELCQAFACLRNSSEVAHLLSDLLGPDELAMVAKRLAIAKLLIAGVTYQQIRVEIHASPTTVARVNQWLHRAGAGYRLAVQRMKRRTVGARVGEPSPVDPDSFAAFKRRFPLTFWPVLLLEEIIRGSNVRQRERLRAVLKTLATARQKPALYRQLENLLRPASTRRNEKTIIL